MGKLKKSVRGTVVHPMTELGREMGLKEMTGFVRPRSDRPPPLRQGNSVVNQVKRGHRIRFSRRHVRFRLNVMRIKPEGLRLVIPTCPSADTCGVFHGTTCP